MYATVTDKVKKIIESTADTDVLTAHTLAEVTLLSYWNPDCPINSIGLEELRHIGIRDSMLIGDITALWNRLHESQAEMGA